MLLPLQLLNGITFAVFWAAGVELSKHHAPPGLQATAQGLFQIKSATLRRAA